MAKKPSKSTSKETPKSLDESLIHPSIRCNEEQHVLEKAFDAGEMPEMKAIGFMKLDTGLSSGNWVSYTVVFKGDKVLRIDVDEPTLKDLAEESAKIAFVDHFIDANQEAF